MLGGCAKCKIKPKSIVCWNFLGHAEVCFTQKIEVIFPLQMDSITVNYTCPFYIPLLYYKMAKKKKKKGGGAFSGQLI